MKAHFIIAFICSERSLFMWKYANTDLSLPFIEFIPSQEVTYVYNCALLSLKFV